MTHRRFASIVLAAAAAPALLAFGPGGVSEGAGKPPQGPPVPLTWTAEVMSAYGGTWDAYTAAAASYTGEGYDDWRLPTVEELQAAAADGSWGNSGPGYLNGSFLLWTSKTQGTWAYGVIVTTNGNGDVVPELSGEAKKVLKGSNLRAKYVRP